MEVQFQLKNWGVELCKKSNLPKVKGTYGLLLGDKVIATQDFNGDYSKEIPFSGELVQKLIDLETDIKNEIQRMLT